MNWPRNRPLRYRARPKRYSTPRHVHDEPLTPGLRKDDVDTEAIGFVHDFGEDDDA